jgi:hypothetical protein
MACQYKAFLSALLLNAPRNCGTSPSGEGQADTARKAVLRLKYQRGLCNGFFPDQLSDEVKSREVIFVGALTRLSLAIDVRVSYMGQI